MPEGEKEEVNILLPELPDEFNPLRRFEATAVAYVSGFVSKKFLPVYGSCIVCKANIMASEQEKLEQYHELTCAKEYGGSKPYRLKYINRIFYNNITCAYNIILYLVPIVLRKQFFSHSIVECIKARVNFNFAQCDHAVELESKIITYFLRIVIFNYLKQITRILQGRDQRPLPATAAAIFRQASTVSLSRRKRNMKN